MRGEIVLADYLDWLNLFALVLAAVGSLVLAIYGLWIAKFENSIFRRIQRD